MRNIFVRRRSPALGGSFRDIVLDATNLEIQDQLCRILKRAQSERGLEPWSSDDPEVLVGNRIIGRLAPDGNIDALVGRTMDVLRACPQCAR